MADIAPDVLECDYIVIGSGIAGLTSAAYAAHQGKSVIVVEKATSIGGSSIISGGGFWSTRDYETMRAMNPDGEDHQARVIADKYDVALEWIKEVGAMVTYQDSGLGPWTFPERFAYIDIIGYLNICAAYVRDAGGHIVVDTVPETLTVEAGRVVGIRVRNADGSLTDLRSDATLLATGGFQGSREMREKYIGPAAADMLVRSNPNSTGDGLKLALAAGAGLSKHMNSFYGHTMPWPLNRPIMERDFIPLAQFGITPRAILIDRNGKRFRDESLGYYLNAQALLDQPENRALLVFDAAVHQRDSELSMHGFDRPAYARELGANVAQAATLAELAALVEPWGYPGVATAVERFNAAVRADNPAMEPPRKLNQTPLDVAPFYAIEIQPAITYTHGGLKIDECARVLTADGEVIPGLFAAGADTGGNYHVSYSGGLSVGAIWGLQAAKAVTREFIA